MVKKAVISKKILILISLGILMYSLMNVSALDTGIYRAETLKLNLNVSSGFEVKPKNDDFRLNFVKIVLFRLPFDEGRQQVESSSFSPEPLKTCVLIWSISTLET